MVAKLYVHFYATVILILGCVDDCITHITQCIKLTIPWIYGSSKCLLPHVNPSSKWENMGAFATKIPRISSPDDVSLSYTNREHWPPGTIFVNTVNSYWTKLSLGLILSPPHLIFICRYLYMLWGQMYASNVKPLTTPLFIYLLIPILTWSSDSQCQFWSSTKNAEYKTTLSLPVGALR